MWSESQVLNDYNYVTNRILKGLQENDLEDHARLLRRRYSRKPWLAYILYCFQATNTFTARDCL